MKYIVTVLGCALGLATGIAFGQGTQSQTIKLFPISDQTFGVAPFQVIAIASSGLPVTLSASGPATLNGRLLTITGVGTVTISAHQAGNSVYASADVQEAFKANPDVPTIQWNPASIIYGAPLDSTILNASATALPAVNPAADIPSISWQLNTSQLTGGSNVTYSWSSSDFRFEGPPMVPTTTPDSESVIVDPTIQRAHSYRVAFTCDCREFEFVIESAQSSYRLWVDGTWTSYWMDQQDNYPRKAFYLVQFPDKRPRQIRLEFTPIAFFGVVTTGSDTISPAQVPIESTKVTVFGDSWPSPTVVQAALPQYQDPNGPGASGFGQILGGYFNWNWFESGLGGSGFIVPGAYPPYTNFLQREQTDLCNPNPNIVIVMGGINDASQPEAALEQAVTQFLSQLQGCLPSATIFLLGPQVTVPSSVATAMETAAAKFSNAFYYDNPSAENWLYGSSTDPSTGNDYLYLNAHPTPLGHDYLAEKIANFILGVLPSLAPQTFPLFNPAPASGSFSYSVANNVLLPAGQQPISATFTPQDSADYTTVTQEATLTVEKASTTTSLSSSASNIVPGSTLALTGKVVPQIGGAPTGSVTFLDNGNAIGTAPLNSSGIASFSTTTLAIGTHAISASYAGDGNFFGSAANQTVSVVVAKPDFNFSVDSTQLTVLPTQSASTTVTVTPISGLVANLNLSCPGLPANAACSLAGGDQIAVHNQTTTATVIIAGYTPKTSSRDETLRLRGIEVCGLLGLGLLLGRRNRRAISGLIASVLLIFAGFALLSGCGSNAKINTAQPGTYSVQLTLSNAADASMTHSQMIALTIP